MDFTSKQFSFDSKERTCLIGEIGVNHNRDKKILMELIDKGIECGVDVLKFQRFNSELEISSYAEKTNYQKNTSEALNQLEMAKSLELPDEWLIEAFEYCKKRKVGFLCTGFEYESVDFIAKELNCSSIKIPSPDITNIPLLEYISGKFEGIILSTGASNIEDCRRAVEIFKDNELVILHCLSEYPAPIDEINLRAMWTLEKEFGKPVGYSDHTKGSLIPIIASSMGAVAIEKHFTLDKKLEGPDHNASADLEELKQISNGLESVFVSQGSGLKEIAKAEEKNINLIRKSVCCGIKRINKGTVLEENMLGIKRPIHENSIQPYDLKKILGKKINKDKEFDDPILWSDID